MQKKEWEETKLDDDAIESHRVTTCALAAVLFDEYLMHSSSSDNFFGLTLSFCTHIFSVASSPTLQGGHCECRSPGQCIRVGSPSIRNSGALVLRPCILTVKYSISCIFYYFTVNGKCYLKRFLMVSQRGAKHCQ